MDAYQTVPVSSLTHSSDSTSYLEPTIANTQQSSNNTLVEIERQDSPRLPLPDFSSPSPERSREPTVDVDEWAARNPSEPPRQPAEQAPLLQNATLLSQLERILYNEDAVNHFVRSAQGCSAPTEVLGRIMGEFRDTQRRSETMRRTFDAMQETLGRAAEQAAILDMLMNSIDQHQAGLVNHFADYAEILHPDARMRIASTYERYFGPTDYDYEQLYRPRSPSPAPPRTTDPRRSFRNSIPSSSTAVRTTSAIPNGGLSTQKSPKFTSYHAQSSNSKPYDKKQNYKRHNTPHSSAGYLPRPKNDLSRRVTDLIFDAAQSAAKQGSYEQTHGYGSKKARGARR